MFHSQLSRKLCLAVAAAGLLAVAGCSNQPTNQAANQAPNQAPAKAAPAPKKAAVPKTAPAQTSKPAVAKQKAATPKAVPVSAKVTQPGPSITVPKGTAITATVGQTLSTKNHSGDTFAASLASPVKVHGKTVLPKGAKVTGKVVAVRKHEIKVELASVVIHGKSYDLETNSLRPSDKLQAKSSSAATDKSSDKSTDKQKKDNSTLSAKSQLTFKLAKPVTVPVKG
jgi:glucose/arabinose dehydrogenase